MKKSTLPAIGLLVLTIILSSWGSVGHRKISESASLSFTPEMHEFNSWINFLRDHASDPDYRRSTDSSEGIKHYIDLDNYPEFVSDGRISSSLKSVMNKHGQEFVYKNGLLPWATLAAFDSLKACLKRNDLWNARRFAADLGHYVADGHMPLHLTGNYDGQFTGNTGIHSRYESGMINTYISQINYTGKPVVEIADIDNYIFDYLYANEKYCDSVLLADDLAQKADKNLTSTAYRAVLWKHSQNFTVQLFGHASHAFASLLYTAWIQAGKPALDGPSLNGSPAVCNSVLEKSEPNPFNASTRISYALLEPTKTLLEVRDLDGALVDVLVKGEFPKGEYTCDWDASAHPAGEYYLVLNTGKLIHIHKLLVQNK